jgi:hypothetical protein
VNQSNATTRWLKRWYAIAGGVILFVVLVLTGWWWTNRPPATIHMEGGIVINEPSHYTVAEDGSCLGTRTGYMGGSDVIIELDSGEEHTVVMEPGRLDGSACRLEFSGEVADPFDPWAGETQVVTIRPTSIVANHWASFSPH